MTSPRLETFSHPWLQAELELVCRRIAPLPEWAELSQSGQHLPEPGRFSQREQAIWQRLPERGPRRQAWWSGRIAVKEALAQWAQQRLSLEVAPAELEIRATELGQPWVDCTALTARSQVPEISISHSRGWAVAAVAQPRQHLGIDLERCGWVRIEDCLQLAFSPAELALLSPAPAAALGFWCAKEAAAKAAGTGLGGVPQQWLIRSCTADGLRAEVLHRDRTFPVRLWYHEREVFAVCQVPFERGTMGVSLSTQEHLPERSLCH